MLWPRSVRELWSWDPWDEVKRLQRHMNRLMSGGWPLAVRLYPPVNVWTSRESALVTAEVPGIDPAKLDITVTGDTLTLSGSRELEKLKEGTTVRRQERDCGDFSRTVQLPFRVDPDKVAAHYERGILRITLPRLEADKPKQIAVKATE